MSRTTTPPAGASGKCQICGHAFPTEELMPGRLVRDPIARTIRKARPDWNPDGFICLDDLNRFRAQHVEDVLAEERGALTDLESEVVRSLEEQETVSRDVNAAFERQLTLGERASDQIAEFGGSWGFILLFGGVMLAWIALNTSALLSRPFDPFPYILLNLVLSCLAAIQAPIIMMSQNRQEAKDRLRSENDYRINLKAELEIRALHAKIDLLLTHQWQRLLEIQKIQMEMMQELIQAREHEQRTPTDVSPDPKTTEGSS